MSQHSPVHQPFETAIQQRVADKLGMFAFLASEIMLFGGLLIVIFVVRILHPHEIVAASKQLHLWIGAINTAILLTSSLAVALGVAFARQGAARNGMLALLGAATLGLAFLAAKAIEYATEYGEGLLPGFGEPTHFTGPVQRLFMNLYLIATSLHAVHVAIGIVLLATLAWRIKRRSLKLPQQAIAIEIGGLYWHLVDVIWVFLYPLLYLAR